jgi:PPOX class probable F420-dependent enzyme
MPKPPLPPKLDEFLREPHPSVIGTVDEDGSPHTAATWFIWENGRVLVNMDAERKRLRHLRADPRVSITVMDRDNWYRQVTLRGRVAALEEDAHLGDIDRISTHYMGEPYSQRDRGRVTAQIEVESWYGWEAGRPWSG